MIKKAYSLLLFLVLFTTLTNAQEAKDSIVLQREARSFVREGNELYKQQKYTDASVSFKKALEKNSGYQKASYNLGNALYQQNNFKEALPQYEVVAKDAKDKFTKAEAFHNIGNSAMEQKQYQQAVDAYKNALRNNPNDDETRYNLAAAPTKLKEQKDKEKKDNKDKKKDKKDDKKKDNKDKKENKDKKGDKEKKDDKGDEKKDDKEKDDKKKDKKDGDKDDQKNPKNPKNKNDQKNKPKPKKGNMTPQQIKQLLESLNNEEKKTQKKMNVKKTKGVKVKQEKDW